MPKPRIYVDTTIPSAYYTQRTDPMMIRWHAATRRWWDLAMHTSELLISRAVLKELSQGTSEEVVLRLALVKDLEVLKFDDEVGLAAATYIRHKLMPMDPEGDALHLAMASYHRCDALVTWNFQHLANVTKLVRIKKLNEEMGLSVPRLLSPLDLMEER